MNDSPSNQRVERAQLQLVHAQLAPHSHTEPQVHVGVHGQGDAQRQLVDVMVVFAFSVVVFM